MKREKTIQIAFALCITIVLSCNSSKTVVANGHQDVPCETQQTSEDAARAARAKCLQKSMAFFVRKNFDTSVIKGLRLSPGEKQIVIIFGIDNSGKAFDVVVIAPHQKLKEEGFRLIQLLQTKVATPRDAASIAKRFTLPIRFTVK